MKQEVEEIRSLGNFGFRKWKSNEAPLVYEKSQKWNNLFSEGKKLKTWDNIYTRGHIKNKLKNVYIHNSIYHL